MGVAIIGSKIEGKSPPQSSQGEVKSDDGSEMGGFELGEVDIVGRSD